MRLLMVTWMTALAGVLAPTVSLAQSQQAIQQAAAAAAETRSTTVMGCVPQMAELTVAMRFSGDGQFAAANLGPGAPDVVTQCVGSALAGIRLPGAVPEGTTVQHVFRAAAQPAQAQPQYAQAQPQAQPQYAQAQPQAQPQYAQAQPQAQPQYAQAQPQAQPQYAAAPVAMGVQPMPPDMRDWPFMAHVIFRLGHFRPFGGLEDSHMPGAPELSLAESSGGSTVFFLGGGARVNNIAVDLIFGIGGAGLSGRLDDAINAAGYDSHGFLNILFGLEGTYYFRRGSDSVAWPFVGVALAYEALITGGDRDGNNYYRSYGCFQVRPSVGVDFALTPAFGLGIALEMGLGAFGDVSESFYPDDDVTTLEDESVTRETKNEISNSGGIHGWLGVSARIVLFP